MIIGTGVKEDEEFIHNRTHGGGGQGGMSMTFFCLESVQRVSGIKYVHLQALQEQAQGISPRIEVTGALCVRACVCVCEREVVLAHRIRQPSACLADAGSQGSIHIYSRVGREERREGGEARESEEYSSTGTKSLTSHANQHLVARSRSVTLHYAKPGRARASNARREEKKRDTKTPC